MLAEITFDEWVLLIVGIGVAAFMMWGLNFLLAPYDERIAMWWQKRSDRKWNQLVQGYPPEIVQVLRETLSDRGIVQWMNASNRVLQGARPIDALKEGYEDSVLEAAHAYAEGAYV